MAVDYEDLPFDKRPDLTPYLIHLTKARNGRNAFDNLVEILKSGTLIGSNARGYIKGGKTASCFMDVPFSALKYVLTPENMDEEHPRYEPFGIFITKKFAYKKGVRPVLYLSNGEADTLGIQPAERWRVVRFEAYGDNRWISWLHEREWRCKGNFELPTNCCVLVKNPKDYKRLLELIQDNPDDFHIKPRAIIPLSVICQGFIDTPS